MDFYLMYAMPLLLGITIGAVFILFARERLRARVDTLVEDRLADIRRANEQLVAANRQLAEQAITDPLTGLLNRRFLTTHLARESARLVRLREGKRAGVRGNILLVVDIDDFKDVNDRYGHVRGDETLIRFADVLRSCVRDSDYVVRWGGEEFVVLATEACAEDGEVIAERILACVRDQDIFNDPAIHHRITCSIGVSHFPFFPDHARALDWQQVLEVADLCAYTAKRNGKDGWVGLRGRQYDSRFRYAALLDEIANAPDQLFLDDRLLMTRSMAGQPVAPEPVLPQ